MRETPTLPQDDRVCDECGKRFLSGIVHIERHYLVSMLCYTCCEKGISLKRLKALSKAKWDKRRIADPT
jgi:hypothetical protein